MLDHQGHCLQPGPHTATLTEEAKDVVRRMKSVGVHAIPICEFIRSRCGIAIFPLDVEAVSARTDGDITGEDTKQLEAEERVDFFYRGVGLIVDQGRLLYADETTI
jgi:hypothetical protein